MNERKTENIVRNHFKSSLCIKEEQKSDNPRIQKLLVNASKKGSGCGKPEFIYSGISGAENLIIIVECKADILKHESKTRDKYSEYAVDGVRLYASHLIKEFDVLAIAVSGETNEELKVYHCLYKKGNLVGDEKFGNKLLSIENYIKVYNNAIEISKVSMTQEDLKMYAGKLNGKLHAYKIPESQRVLLISAILISLRNKQFKEHYKSWKKPKDLSDQLLWAISTELKDHIPTHKLTTMMAEFEFIKTNTTIQNEKDMIMGLIDEIYEKIFPMMGGYHPEDILGILYIEFLQYANTNASLGIVLTPPHITDLFCELANINKNTILLDNCTGTGGFLIAGMRRMMNDAKGDQNIIKNIKEKQLLGIEYMSHMYALAASNMIVHGDGKANLFLGSCFDDEIISDAKKFKANVGMLNPPYKTQGTDYYEMEFILNNLSMLEKGGTCIAIIPMSCILSISGKEKDLKNILLKNHTLEAVISLPEQLFHNSNVGVVTCVVIIKAHQPHPKNYESIFLYCKDDGFTKRKNTGRQDYDCKWDSIKEYWINTFRNKNEIPGFSVKKYVTADDEWCAEAYIETDYLKLTEKDFVQSIKDFVIFSFSNGLINNASDKNIINGKINLTVNKWKSFTVDELFKIEKMNASVKDDEICGGKHFLLSAIDSNNGVKGNTNKKPHEGNVITINNNGSVGLPYYQPHLFCSTADVSILNPLFKLNPYIGLFLVTILKSEKYRYSYGRKANGERLTKLKIKLPSRADGTPDFEYMENYIKTLPYSSSL